MEVFRLNVSEQDRRSLKDLARLSIATAFAGKDQAPPEPETGLLLQELGAFVTLKIHDDLRGCIGNVLGSGPLYRTIWKMARAAAFEDPRFPALTAREFEDVDIEISILGPVEPCPDPQLIEIGRHGLIMSRSGRSGLLLPQVPVEWGWDREQFLAHTCQKASLPPTAWRDPETQIFWFEAVVF